MSADTNLTRGPILKKLVMFSLPMLAGNMLQQIYSLADAMIVGKYIGADALAAVGASYTLMVFVNSIIIGLCMGNGVIFSADYGAGNHAVLKKDIGHSFVFVAAVTLVLNIILFAGMRVILKFLQIPDEIFDMARDYVSVIFSGIVFIFLFHYFAYLLRSFGNAFIPLVFLGIASVMNIVLDVLFIMKINMGVGGAALATVISQFAAGAGIAGYVFLKTPELGRSLLPRKTDVRRLKHIIVNDLGTAMQQSVMNFGILMIQGLVNSFGAGIMASFAAAVKIDTFAYMPAQEFGNAYSLFISQNRGAGEAERIKKGTRYSFLLSVAFCLAVSVLIWHFAGALMELFVSPEETEIIQEGIRYLRIEGAMYIGIGMLFLWYGYFRGMGKPYISLVLTIISLGTRVVLSYTLAPNTALGVTAIWYSIPIGWFLADLAGMIICRRQQDGTV